MAAVTLARLTAILSLSLPSLTVAQNDECGIYLAVSSTSTPDETRWGTFAGKDIAAQSLVGVPEIAINAFHLKAHILNDDDDEEEEQSNLVKMTDFFESFVWVPEHAGAKFELSQGRSVTAIPGLGMLGAFNMHLTNSKWNQTASYLRPAMGEEPGIAHPGRGAVSPFYNVALQTTTNISAGSEIFVDYGENYEEDEMKEEVLLGDYAKIDETIDKIVAFFEKHEDTLNEEHKEQIYHFITRDVMNAAVGPGKARKIAAILPSTPEELVQVKEVGGSLAYSAPSVHPKLEWLKENGRCMDHIRPGPSTIPHAGRGAFASRSIKKGNLVAPIPLLHIADSSIFDMHNVVISESGEYIKEDDDVVGKQLIYNYCLGHPDSDMLFFPSGSVTALINHNDKPNAKLVWSTHPSHESDWLQLDPTELMEEEHHYLGLLLEVVATRDIKAGEEVFIDYGNEWKAAWNKHVAEWENKQKEGKMPQYWPLRAVDLNTEYRHKPFRTVADLEKEPYPENVELRAFLLVGIEPREGTIEDPKEWDNGEDRNAFDSDNLFPIEVLDYAEIKDDLVSPYNYTVRWTNGKGKTTYVVNVPHRAITFVDKPETGDQFVDEPFRHYIGFPDEIFPAAWRNLGKN